MPLDLARACSHLETPMKTRIAVWTLLVMCVHALTGCGRSEPSLTPLAPSPPAPRRPLVDLTGSYTLTFEAGTSCEQLPEELRTRTYLASISYAGPAQNRTGDYFYADLSGASFQGEYSRLVIHVVDNAVRFDLSDNIVAEKPASDTYLMIAGDDDATSVDPSDFSTTSSSFNGFFEYCVTTSPFRPGSHCPIDTVATAVCQAEDSRWTLTRR
jgi:hypothetical protein